MSVRLLQSVLGCCIIRKEEVDLKWWIFFIIIKTTSCPNTAALTLTRGRCISGEAGLRYVNGDFTPSFKFCSRGNVGVRGEPGE